MSVAYAPFVPMNLRDLVFLDLETSGLDPDDHEIVEFAAVRTSADTSREISSFSHRCAFDLRKATAEALQTNHYDPTDWLDAEPVRVALTDFVTLLGPDESAVVIGQNVGFDVGFVRATARREAFVLPRWKYTLDVASMAWPLVVKGNLDRIGLDHLCQRYGVSNDGAHRALTDVRRTIEVYRCLMGFKKGKGGR